MNSTNETFYPLSYWFDLFGYTYIFDSLYFFALTPICLISLGLNIMTFHALNKKPFMKSRFFSYMRYYVFNGIFQSLISMTTFIINTHNFFEFTNTYEALFYGIYIYFSLFSSSLLFGSCLEILMVIERSLYFLPAKFKKIKIINIKIISIIVLLISVFINAIFIFLTEPAYSDVQLSEKTWHRIWYFGFTSFSSTLAGSILNFLVHIIRDIFPLILKIALNSLIVYLVKDYSKKLQMEKLEFAQKITFTKENDQNTTAEINTTHYNFISKTDRNQTFVAILMSLFSLFEHAFNILWYFIYLFNRIVLSNAFLYAALLSVLIKLICNFFILYKFNCLFRNEIKKMFKFTCILNKF